MIRVYANKRYLDLTEDVSMKLNREYVSTGGNQSPIGSFSYGINIPATKNNLEAISYKSGYYTRDGISAEIESSLLSSKLNAVMYVNSVTVNTSNSQISIQIVDPVTYILKQTDLEFEDLIDDIVSVNDIWTEGNLWARRYFDTTGEDTKYTIVCDEELKGIPPFTIKVNELAKAVFSKYGLSSNLSIPDDLEVTIPVKDLISSKFKAGDTSQFSLNGTFSCVVDSTYQGTHDKLTSLAASSKGKVFSLVSGSINSSYKNGVIDSQYVYSYDTDVLAQGARTYFTTFSTAKCFIKDIDINLEQLSSQLIRIRGVYADGKGLGYERVPYIISEEADVALVLSLLGKDTVIAKGTVSTVATAGCFQLKLNKVTDIEELYRKALELTPAEDIYPVFKLVALSVVNMTQTSNSNYPEKVTWAGYSMFATTSSDEQEKRQLFVDLVWASDLSAVNMTATTTLELIKYSDDEEYISITGVTKRSDQDYQDIHIGKTLDTSGHKPVDIIKDYINRFNVKASFDGTSISSSSSTKVLISTADADNIEITSPTSDSMTKDYSISNAKGDSAFDEYTDGTGLGDSGKIVVDSSGSQEIKTSLNSTILPLKLCGDIRVLDENDADMINEYGNAILAGVFRNETMSSSKYSLRYGFKGSLETVRPLVKCRTYETFNEIKGEKKVFATAVFDSSWMKYSLITIERNKVDGSSVESLAFNDREAEYYPSKTYSNALDTYFGDVVKSIYSTNSIMIEGLFYLNNQQCEDVLLHNPKVFVDGEEYIIQSVSDVELNSSNGCLVKLKMYKKL
jgi:hypothetical protein